MLFDYNYDYDIGYEGRNKHLILEFDTQDRYGKFYVE